LLLLFRALNTAPIGLRWCCTRHPTFGALTMRRPLACLFFLPLAAICVVPVLAQEPLTENDKAVVAFDIYVDRLTGSETAKASGMEDPSSALPIPPSDIDPKDVRRVFGAVSAPADVASVAARQGSDPLPMNFFVRVQFKTPEAADKAYQGMAATGQAVTLGGNQYYRPPADDNDSPSNLLLHMSAADTLEFGTDGFLLQPSRNLFTDGLLDSWKKMPKAAIRIAADLDGARGLINQGMQAAQAGGGIPADAMPAVAIVENSAGLRFALDFSSESMLWLTLSGRDAGSTGIVKGTMDQFLAMGKGFGQQGLQAVPDENIKKVAGEILNALQTTQDGNDVNLVLPRPEGFEEAMGEAAKMAMGGMFGGPGGPGAPGAFEPAPADAEADPFGGDPFGN
jgi:hypothetical protein